MRELHPAQLRRLLDAFDDTHAHWAIDAQTHLSDREPINWVQQIDSHNAYNNWADGFVLPNQWFSLSDQLDLGVRALELDPNEYAGWSRVCHAKADDAGCSAVDRAYENSLIEIRTWLDANPDEVIILRMENYHDGPGHLGDFRAYTDKHLGDIALRWSPEGSYGGFARAGSPWPSRAELLADGKQVVIFDYFHGLESVAGTTQFGRAVTDLSIDSIMKGFYAEAYREKHGDEWDGFDIDLSIVPGPGAAVGRADLHRGLPALRSGRPGCGHRPGHR